MLSNSVCSVALDAKHFLKIVELTVHVLDKKGSS